MAKKKARAPKAPPPAPAAPAYKIDIPRAFGIVKSNEATNITLYHLVEMEIRNGVVVKTKVSQANVRGALIPQIEDAMLDDA